MSAFAALIEVGMLSPAPSPGIGHALTGGEGTQADVTLPLSFVVISMICDLVVLGTVVGLVARSASRRLRLRSARSRHASAAVDTAGGEATAALVERLTARLQQQRSGDGRAVEADPGDFPFVVHGDEHDEGPVGTQAGDELAPVVQLGMVRRQHDPVAGEDPPAAEDPAQEDLAPVIRKEWPPAEQSRPSQALSNLLSGTAPPATDRALPRLNIALVGEGTYPFGPGGVSLWCHQLIEGMPEYSFTAVALTVDGTERSMWAPAQNLTRVLNIPLWGEVRGRGPRLHGPRSSFLDAYHALLGAVLESPQESVERGQGANTFEAALRAMVENAPAGDVSRELSSDQAVQQLLWAWRESGVGRLSKDGQELTLRDAFAGTSRLEHMLRPLSHQPLEVDVCHLAMGGLSVLVGLRSKWATGTPLVLSEHGVYLRERYLALGSDSSSQPVKLLTTRFHRALMSAAYRNADVLAPHSSFNRRWQSYGGGDAKRTETMYNGIDPAAFPVAAEEPEQPTIVFVGRIDRLKDLHTLIRAFAIVRAELPEAKLRMFGPVTGNNQEYHRTCLALVDELGLTGAAVFEGRIADTAEAYRAGHVVALTSVSEGFPFTVIEAMSVGRPPVATDVGGVSEAVGEAGFIVAPRDHQAVAQACLTLLRDADLRRRMGQHARQRVLDLFTLSQWTNAYSEIYAALAPSASPRHAVRATSTSSLVEILQQNRGGALEVDAERPAASEFSA